jgi:predicted nucleic acid-binding protein
LVVLDTSVVSYVFNGDSRADYYKERIRGERCVISFQTLEEVRFGAYKRGWGDRRKNELERYLQQYEIIWASPELVRHCAHLRSESEKIGRALATADAWIAATALLLECPLASHD